MTIHHLREALLAAGLLLAVPACAQPPAGPPVLPQDGKAPDLEARLAHACYPEIEPGKDVCLKDGRSEGPPVVELGPERATGDLDGDGVSETAVLLTKSPKGPDQAVYLVIAAWRGDRVATLAATLLGSQVRVQSLQITGGKVRLQGQRSASARTAMMPVSLAYSLREGKLVPEEGPRE
jgi:hypothetical protein